MLQQLIQQQLDVDKVVKESGLPAYEADVELLVDNFCWQVRHGAPPSLTTFKQLWQASSFSLIYQAVPTILQPADFLQLLYSAALNRLDCPVGPFLVQLLRQQQQQAQSEPVHAPILLLPAPPAVSSAPPPANDMVTPNPVSELNGMQKSVLQQQQDHAAQVQQLGGPDGTASHGTAALLCEQQQQQQQQHDSQPHAELPTAQQQDSLALMLVDDVHNTFMDLDLPPLGPVLCEAQQAAREQTEPQGTCLQQAEPLHAYAQHADEAGHAQQHLQQHISEPADIPPLAGLQQPMHEQPDPLTDLLKSPQPNEHHPNCHQHYDTDAQAAGPADPTAGSPADKAGFGQLPGQDQFRAQQEQLDAMIASTGALYCVYCLYQAQLTHPRTHIYLPLQLLQHLEQQLIPSWCKLGFTTPIRCLQVLWQDNAFLIGAVRKPRHGTFVPVRAQGAAGSRAAGTGVGANPLIMQSRPIRDALLHLRSSLKALTDFSKLSALSQDYAAARTRVFQHKTGKGAPPQRQSDTDMFEQPPFIYDESWPQQFKAKVDEVDRSAQDALSLLSSGTSKPAKVKQKAWAKAAAQSGVSLGAVHAQAGEDDSTRLIMVSGLFGDILRRKMAKATPASEPKAVPRAGAALEAEQQQRRHMPVRPAGAVVGSPSAKQKQKQQSRAAALLNARLRQELREAGLLVGPDAELDKEEAEALSNAVHGSAAEVVRRDAERRAAHMCVASTWLYAHDALMQEDADSDEDMPDLFAGPDNSVHAEAASNKANGGAATGKAQSGRAAPLPEGPAAATAPEGDMQVQQAPKGKAQQQQQQQQQAEADADAELEKALSEWVEEGLGEETSQHWEEEQPDGQQHGDDDPRQPAAPDCNHAEPAAGAELLSDQEAAAAAQELEHDRAAAGAAAARAMPSSRASSAAWLRRKTSAAGPLASGAPDGMMTRPPANQLPLAAVQGSCKPCTAVSKEGPAAEGVQAADAAPTGRLTRAKRQRQVLSEAEQSVAASGAEAAAPPAAKRARIGRKVKSSVHTSTEQRSGELSMGQSLSDAVTSPGKDDAGVSSARGTSRRPAGRGTAKEAAPRQSRAGRGPQGLQRTTAQSVNGAVNEGKTDVTSVANAPQQQRPRDASKQALQAVSGKQTLQPIPGVTHASSEHALGLPGIPEEEDEDDADLLIKEALAATQLVAQLRNTVLLDGNAATHATAIVMQHASEASLPGRTNRLQDSVQPRAERSTSRKAAALALQQPAGSSRTRGRKQGNSTSTSSQQAQKQAACAAPELPDVSLLEAARTGDVVGMGLAIATAMHLDQEAANGVDTPLVANGQSPCASVDELGGLSSDDDIKQALKSTASVGAPSTSQAVSAQNKRLAKGKPLKHQSAGLGSASAISVAVTRAAAATQPGKAPHGDGRGVAVGEDEDDDEDALLASALAVHQMNSQQLAQLQR